MFDENSRYENFCQEQPLLLKHLRAVIKHNSTKNLTSIKDLDAGKVLHIEDSLAVLPELEEAPEGMLADLGSGAGFPGIPLALVSGRITTLVEANKKKSEFLRSFIEENALTGGLTVRACRSEELAVESPQAYSVVTARAVAELPVLLELSEPLISPGGYFIALKGKPEAEEIERGNTAAARVGFEFIKTRKYTLSDGESKRCVLVYKKASESTVKLPRRPGMATKRPLA